MQLLSLDPENTLTFCKNSSTTAPSKMLKLSNDSTTHVAFKVKTTAPKAYLVRPSAGVLAPQAQQEVQIILQAQTQAQGGADQSNAPARFLVQAHAVQANDTVTREDWTKFSKETIQEQKLNVVVEEHEGEESTNFEYPPAAANTGTTDLKVKYDELVQYTLTLEKGKKQLEADIAKAKEAKPSPGGEGVTKFTLILAVLIAFMVPYAARFLG